jgi:hypothetical protein
MAEKEKDGKHSVTVRLDDQTYQAIERMATEDERSVSQYCERHLRKAFTPHKGEEKPAS